MFSEAALQEIRHEFWDYTHRPQDVLVAMEEHRSLINAKNAEWRFWLCGLEQKRWDEQKRAARAAKRKPRVEKPRYTVVSRRRVNQHV